MFSRIIKNLNMFFKVLFLLILSSNMLCMSKVCPFCGVHSGVAYCVRLSSVYGELMLVPSWELGVVLDRGHSEIFVCVGAVVFVS